mgnify:CR=1 FL=1
MKMKRTYILLTLLLLFFSDFAFSALSIEGTYQGKNLYVQNPIDDEGFGYCATKVTVNGDIMPGGTGSGAFEIDFGIFNIALGEPVFIVIEHHDGCKPKILNPEVLLPRSTFNVLSINVSEDKLKWETNNENGKLPYIIEQYRCSGSFKMGRNYTGSVFNNQIYVFNGIFNNAITEINTRRSGGQQGE